MTLLELLNGHTDGKCHLIPSKQAHAVLFSNKATDSNHPDIIFNGNMVQNSAKSKVPWSNLR